MDAEIPEKKDLLVHSPTQSKRGSHNSLDQQIARSPHRMKKRVTIQSEATILILRETGLAKVVTDSPYYTQGCMNNVKWAAYIDIILCIIETILCVIAVAYALIISEDVHVYHADTYSIKDLLHAVVGLGVVLTLGYFAEIFLVRRLISEITLPDLDRHQAVREARYWRWSNLALTVLETFFGVGAVMCGGRILFGSGVLVGLILRVVGICIVHQFIQELETVTVTPFTNDSNSILNENIADDGVTSDTNVNVKDLKPGRSSLSLSSRRSSLQSNLSDISNLSDQAKS